MIEGPERGWLLRGGGNDRLTWRTEKGVPPVEMRNVLVNHESLVFKRWLIDERSFVRPIDATHWRRPSRFAWFLLKNAMRRTVRVPAATWITNNFSPGSYYHWMIECLPRLLVARPNTLLLPRQYQRYPFVPFSLQAFPEIGRVGWIGLRHKVRVGRLMFLGRREAQDEELRVVSDRVTSLVSGSGGKRVYLSRRHASRRRLVNEQAVLKVLQPLGFETVIIDPSDPAGQVRAVRDADYLVGVHGAELTNLMFLKGGARVLELRHPCDDAVNDTYAILAAAMGVRHTDHPCNLAPGANESGWNVNFADLVADLDQLEAKLADWI
jgi:capsular polysaccharide biosynthesis protein